MSVESVRRIPSLDGARAVSISFVILYHAVGSYHLPGLWRFDLGLLGVQTFFVISGFLITMLLLQEEKRNGSISIGNFYLRRVLRIMPAYYVFLLIMLALVPTGWLQASYHNFIPAAAYFGDYAFPGRTLGHTWSLAVEEQFYLLLPSALVFLGARRTLYICLVLIIASPVIRGIELGHNWTEHPRETFECVCDALACGCLLAIARERVWSNAIYRNLVRSKFLVLVPLALIGASAIAPDSPIVSTVTYSGLGIAIAAMLDRYMRFPDLGVGRILNWGPAVWLGTISYSLYLWQQPFMFNAHAREIPLALKITGAIACAAASYYLVERPFLRLRARFGSKAPVPARLAPAA